MTQLTEGSKTVAPLTNVGLFMRLVDRAMNCDPRLPRMVCFHGPSGWGKSTAAAYAYQKLNTHYVECRSTMTKKGFLAELLKEIGVIPERTIGAMYQQAVAALEGRRCLLIIDEMDYLVQKSAVDLVRDLHDESGAVIALIGEEQLPTRLKRWERFHGRILAWEAAQPVSAADAAHLARLYAPGVEVAEDLLCKVHALAQGSVRRACVNLSAIHGEALKQGLTRIGLEQWGERPLYTGLAPDARRF